MKKQLLKAMAIGAGMLMATSAGAVITGSAHDFSARWTAGNNPQGQICITCHTPHNADQAVPNAPLWNHDVTTATYTLYSSPTLDATDLTQPTGVSKLCLSCHNGTVALDSFGGMTGTEFLVDGDDAYVGTDLSNDHPVSFTYDDTLAGNDGELNVPSSALSGVDGGTIQEDMLFADQMQCGSCHDVHNSYEQDYLLRKTNAGSALCLTCHDK